MDPASVDPVRSLVCYFGGGHSSNQFNDVAVYAVGANRWLHTAGEANDWVPPVGWGGLTMGLHGGPHAHHQRNTYVALDGRVWRSVGTGSRRWSPEAEKRARPRYAWFWDIDRGGVWRMQKIAKVTLGEGVPGTWGQPHVVDPAGQVGTVLYLQDQNAVFAPAGRDQQWVDSFDENTWARLPVQGELSRFDPVYAQMVYVPEYGVLVNLPKMEIMRPEVSKANWR